MIQKNVTKSIWERDIATFVVRNIITLSVFFGLCACLSMPAFAENKEGAVDGSIGDSLDKNGSKLDIIEKSDTVTLVTPAPLLTVTPKRCVLKSGQDKCRIQLVLRWESDSSHSLCLSVKDDKLALACWEEAVRGATRLLFVGDESVTYILSTEDSRVVSEVIFRIGRISKQKRKSKKRRRRFWGFL